MTQIHAAAGGPGVNPVILAFAMAHAASLAQSFDMNVRRMVRAIHESPEGRVRQAEGRLKCVGAIYEIENGRVRFLDPARLSDAS